MPAAESDRLLRNEPVPVGCHPRGNGGFRGEFEFMVVGEDLQRWTVQTVGSDCAAQRAVQVRRRAASGVVAAPFERGVVAEGVAERAPSRLRSSRPSNRGPAPPDASQSATDGSPTAWQRAAAESTPRS